MEERTSPEAWAALLTLTALEIVLGIDNVIFLSVIVSRIPKRQAKRARQIGLALALVFRIVLLSLLVWLIGLTQDVLTVKGIGFSWRDLILIGGGLFLIAKATHEIHGEVEARDGEDGWRGGRRQCVFLDNRPDRHRRRGVLAGFHHHRDRHGAGPRNNDSCRYYRYYRHVCIGWPGRALVAEHPTTKMLALAFLVLIGVALVADEFKFHIPRGYIYFAIAFSAAVEFFNVLAKRRRRKVVN